MTKFVRAALLVLAITLVMFMFGCSQAYSLSFANESFSAMPETTFQPQIKIAPKSINYTLTSSNPTIAKVDGKNIVALKEGIVTITVQAGDKKDDATLTIINDKDYTSNLPIVMPEYKRINFLVEDYAYSSPMEIQQGMVPGTPNEIIRPGYTLDGWYNEKALATKYDFSSPLNDNVTVYGRWIMLNATFTYENIDGKTYLTGLFYPKVPYTELVLPEISSYDTPIVGIKNATFKNNISLKKVNIPSSYEYIEQEAFSGCTSLEEVYFGEDSILTKIGTSAFNGCTKLKTLTLPNSLTEIKGFAFRNCSALDIQSLPSGLTILEQYVFSKTASVTIDIENITEIWEGAFDGCSLLEGVFNTHNVTKCYKFAFQNTPIYSTSIATYGVAYIDTILVGARENKNSFTLKEGTTLIANEALFSNSLSDIIITRPAQPPTYVGTTAFHSGISIVFDQDYYGTSRNPESSWYVYRSQVCTQFEENDFTLLRYQSVDKFYYSIKSYRGNAVHLDITTALPYEIRSIKSYAFQNTDDFALSLKTLTLGNIETISNYAISNIPTLLAIIMETTAIPTLLGNMSIAKNSLSNGCMKIYVPSSQYKKYRSDWSGLKSIIYDKDIVTDGFAISATSDSNVNYVIQYFGDENTLTVPNDITIYDTKNEMIGIVPLNIISENAFRYNYTLEHLVLGENITEIREAALAHTKLKTLEFLNETPPTIGLYFLEMDKTLETIYVPTNCSNAYKAVLPQKYHSKIVER